MLSENKRLYNIILENYPSLLSCRSTSDKHLNNIIDENIATVRMPVTVSMKLKKTASITHQVGLNHTPAIVLQFFVAVTVSCVCIVQ